MTRPESATAKVPDTQANKVRPEPVVNRRYCSAAPLAFFSFSAKASMAQRPLEPGPGSVIALH